MVWDKLLICGMDHALQGEGTTGREKGARGRAKLISLTNVGHDALCNSWDFCATAALRGVYGSRPCCLGATDHTILHKALRKGSVHALNRDNFPHGPVPDLWPLEDDNPGVPDPNPDRLPPGWKGLGGPVSSVNACHFVCSLIIATGLISAK